MSTPSATGSAGQPPVMQDWPPDISHLITEDDTPVDNIFSEKQQRLLTEPLYNSWHPERKFAALANVGMFFELENAKVMVPDMMLSLDVELDPDFTQKINRSYFVMKHGKVPEVVVEVISNKEGGELDRKFEHYERIKISYYVIFDPEGMIMEPGELRIYELMRSRYELMRNDVLLDVKLRLVKWEGEYEGFRATWIRWAHLNGTLIQTGAERADAEKARAEAEKARADAAEARVKELEAKLAALGSQM